jgi:choline dehydrogenase-like flavoprotein
VTTLHADACVIGSGAGGGPVARELAEGGMSVVVLEEGRRFATDELNARPRDMMPLLYRDAGQTVTEGNVPIVLPLGKAVGGTTVVNSGTCFRTPDRVLDRWVDEHGLEQLTPDRMRPHFEHVERETGVAKVPPELAGKNAEVVKRGADALGWSGDYLQRNARGCVGSGVCAFGCPTGAKQHAGQVWIDAAEKAGARTVTGARARKIETRGGRARVVHAKLEGGGSLEVRADLTVVACGAVHTPLLLRRNRLGAASGQLGRNLAIHPCTAVRAVFDEDVGMADGVPQSYFVDEFASEGIMFEGAAGPPDYLAASLPYSREQLRELMLRFGQVSQFGVMIHDSSRGEVTELAGRARIRYRLSREDLARVRSGVEKLTDLYWAAGARTVLQPVAGVPPLRDGDLGPLAAGRRLRAKDFTLMAFHPLGTARADRDPGRGVVGEDLKLHGLDGLYVSDASVIPSALGVNPQITIMALAHRLGRHLLDDAA